MNNRFTFTDINEVSEANYNDFLDTIEYREHTHKKSIPKSNSTSFNAKENAKKKVERPLTWLEEYKKWAREERRQNQIAKEYYEKLQEQHERVRKHREEHEKKSAL